MKKRTIITILLALVALAGQAKVYKTIKAPKAMASNIYRGELKAREVILADTASTIHFTMEYPQGQNFRFVNTCYLMDEDGTRYPLHAVEGIKFDKIVVTNREDYDRTLANRKTLLDYSDGIY